MNKDLRKKIFLGSNGQSEKRYQFKLAWGSAPHPDKLWKGGEDAFFVSKNIIVVADGVGGWSQLGIDAGIFSRRLVSAIKQLISQKEKQLYFIQNPQRLAMKSVQKNQQKGSSTLSIITVHPLNGTVRSYHVGDSIYAILKNQGIYFVAQQQQKQFNVPFQVFGIPQNQNRPDHMQSEDEQIVQKSDVQRGIYKEFCYNDIFDGTILLASDGLWDNLKMEEIHGQLFTNQSLNLVSKTKTLVKKAKQNALLQEYESPFFLKAKRQGHQVQKCGKIDDICLILAQIVLV